MEAALKRSVLSEVVVLNDLKVVQGLWDIHKYYGMIDIEKLVPCLLELNYLPKLLYLSLMTDLGAEWW